MQSTKNPQLSCTHHLSNAVYVLSRRLRRLCSTIRWFMRRRRRHPKLTIKRLTNLNPKIPPTKNTNPTPNFHQNTQKPIRIATFNAALFSLAPAIPTPEKDSVKMMEEVKNGNRTVYDVMKEVDADIWTVQDVKAEEGKGMSPLSELTQALGMSYVFAESWAPEYGNALLSKWPIKKWKILRICDDKDFRNVIKATIDVPWAGEINVYSTQLDHLDENWRIKQMNAIIQSNDKPHILAGGLNSLDASDYSPDRWNDIVKYYQELGKPTPKAEVTNFLKGKGYVDAKHFAGECEPLLMITKGQNVQGTCKYGTRVDYILGSSGLGYMFVPGSYSVISSEGTSDHHIVKVDVLKVGDCDDGKSRRWKKLRQRIARMRGD